MYFLFVNRFRSHISAHLVWQAPTLMCIGHFNLIFILELICIKHFLEWNEMFKHYCLAHVHWLVMKQRLVILLDGKILVSNMCILIKMQHSKWTYQMVCFVVHSICDRHYLLLCLENEMSVFACAMYKLSLINHNFHLWR